MKQIKQLIIFAAMAAVAMTLLSTVTMLTGCSPQPKRPAMEVPSPDKRLYTLKHRLQLTDKQMAAIKPILESEHARKAEIMENAEPGDREAMRATKEQIEDLEWNIYKRLSEHLTPKQMELYSKLLEEEKAKMEAQRGPQKGGKRGGGGRRGGGF